MVSEERESLGELGNFMELPTYHPNGRSREDLRLLASEMGKEVQEGIW